MLEQGGSWDTYLMSIEFTYNNNFHSSIRMEPFEVLYDRRYMCRSWAKDSLTDYLKDQDNLGEDESFAEHT